MNQAFPIPEVAQRLVALAMSAAQEENWSFYVARYNSSETMTGDSVKSESDIQKLLYAAYVDAAVLMLGSECACPYSSFVSDEMLHWARCELVSFSTLHEDIERFVSERWNGEVGSTSDVFDIVAEWLSTRLLKEPNGTAVETFCTHFRKMKIKAISLIDEYFHTAEE